jgi:hypothetical protein
MLSIGAATGMESYGSFQGCGRYQIGAIVRKDKTDVVSIVVGEKSNSEYKFKIQPEEWGQYTGYFDLPISAEVNILKIDGTLGFITESKNIKLITPHPLNSLQSTGFRLIKKLECVK